MIDSPDSSGQISAGLRKVLNTHGYGFHYAVVRRGEELSENNKTNWILEGTEIPVVAGGATTHVDVVWSTRSELTKLVSECKRADPAKARWCFARSPYRWFGDVNSEKELAFDQLVLNSDRTRNVRPCFGYKEQGSYQIAVDLRTGQKGDGEGKSSKAIDDAIAQVLRSTSGIINESSDLVKPPSQGEKTVTFVPVIFTTAEVWTTEADLGAADLATGNLTAEQVKAEEAKWIWFTYNRSPQLSHFLPYENKKDDLSQLIRQEFARSVAIVGAGGIDEFLQTDLEGWLETTSRLRRPLTSDETRQFNSSG
jgi:hypothetical protein